MRFAILKNVHLGLIGQTGRLVHKHVEAEQEVKYENVFFQSLETLQHCVQEKRKKKKSATWTHVRTGQTGRNGHSAQKRVVQERKNVQENALL